MDLIMCGDWLVIIKEKKSQGNGDARINIDFAELRGGFALI